MFSQQRLKNCGLSKFIRAFLVLPLFQSSSFIRAVTASVIAFLVGSGAWGWKTTSVVDKMECFAECLTRIIRHMSISSLTEHLVTIWILIRRTQCAEGLDSETTANISYQAIGDISRQRGYKSLRELERTQLLLGSSWSTQFLKSGSWQVRRGSPTDLADSMEDIIMESPA